MTSPFPPSLSRRSMMALVTGMAALRIRPAQAFSTVPGAEDARLRSLHATACGATASHQQLVDEVNQVLGERYDAAQKKAVVANLSCPICGCPLAGLF